MGVMAQTRGAQRREQILRATLAVVGRGGIAAVTHRTVADEAGVALGAMTYYFESKQELLREALLLFVEEEAARLRAAADGLEADEPTPAEVGARMSAVLEADDRAQIGQFELYLEAARDPALRDAAQRCFAAYEEVSCAALRAVGVSDAERLAPLFVGLADGLGLRRVAAGDGPELAAALLELLGAAADARA